MVLKVGVHQKQNQKIFWEENYVVSVVCCQSHTFNCIETSPTVGFRVRWPRWSTAQQPLRFVPHLDENKA